MPEATTLLEQTEQRLRALLGHPAVDDAYAIGWTLSDGVGVAIDREGSRDVGGDVAYVWMPADASPDWMPHEHYDVGRGRSGTIEDVPGLDRARAADQFKIVRQHELDEFGSHLMRQFPLRIRQWRIDRGGRPWPHEEALQRFYLAPRKIEMADAMLFFREEQRLTMLALLLENVGVDQAVRLGEPEVWRAAVAALK
jgi:hypothetical protein